MIKICIYALLMLVFGLFCNGLVFADGLDLSTYDHNDKIVVGGGPVDLGDVTLSVDSRLDELRIFDTTLSPTLPDDNDLLFQGGWAGGNAQSTSIGNVLIIQEFKNNPPSSDYADDQRGQNAGTITFDFEGKEINNFGFYLVDIEGSAENGWIEFYRNGSQVGTRVVFSDFSGVSYGNRTLNQIAPFNLDGGYDEVVVHFNGSGAIGGITWGVPEPSTLILLSSGLGILGLCHRRRSKN